MFTWTNCQNQSNPISDSVSSVYMNLKCVSGLKFHAVRGQLIGLRCLHEEVLVHLTHHSYYKWIIWVCVNVATV